METYSQRLLHRALADTKSDLGLGNRRRVLIKIVWTLVALFIMWMFGWHDLVIERVGEIWGAVLALITLLVLMFVLNFFSAPARIDAEQRQEIENLNRKIDDREARQAALDNLWRLRKSGVDLRNKRITKDEYRQWYDDYRTWNKEMLGEAEKISRNLHQWLETLERRPENPVAEPIDGDHHKVLCNFSEVLRRLGDYLEAQIVKE